MSRPFCTDATLSRLYVTIFLLFLLKISSCQRSFLAGGVVPVTGSRVPVDSCLIRSRTFKLIHNSSCRMHNYFCFIVHYALLIMHCFSPPTGFQTSKCVASLVASIHGSLAVNLIFRISVENNGFEPLTPCVQGRCSSQLS